MTLTQLRYLVALDTHRHFGRAAAACHVSQPTLSAQLQKLEEALGVPLFERKPVVPTDIGARVLAQARVALHEAARVEALAAEAQGEVAGELVLGMIPTLASSLLPIVTGPFAERHPRVRLVVRELPTATLLDGLAADRLDAALIATPETRPGLEARPLFTEPFVAYVGAGHPLADRAAIAPQDLRLDDLWLLSEGHCFRDQVLAVCAEAADASRPVRFESGSLETLRRMVDQAGGLTLLPHLATRYLSAAQRRHVRPLAEPVPRREVRVVYGRAYLKRAAVDAYAATVADVIAPLLP